MFAHLADIHLRECSMHRLPLFIVVLLPAVLSAQGGADSLAVQIDREVRRLARAERFWPGYRPDTISLAIFTGDRTFLFRHPSPPDGFREVAPGVRAMPGRHPAVTANSSAPIGGRPVATLLADRPGGEHAVRRLAAVALHEAFHVFQRARHPGWSGNEGDLFTYPFERADLLSLRREEADLLRRANAAAGPLRRCYARSALARRAARFAAMAPAYARYERLSELNEGLATWIQLRAEGRTSSEIPAEEYPATAVRDRFYTVGATLAFLLDDVHPGWPEQLERADSLTLDVLLTDALAGKADATACPVAPSELAAIRARAHNDAGRVVAERQQARAAFAAAPGWRLVVEAAGGQPLWPKGFDPLNVLVVDGGVLHRRMLAVGNEAFDVALVDGPGADLTALTVGAGAHPLFNGVRRLEVVGLPQPAIAQEGERTTVIAPGLTASFRSAQVRTDGTTIVVTPRAP